MVGGGVMGSSAAWHLADRGYDVTLLEQFEPGHDRGSSHGSSRIFRLAYPDPFYVDLAIRALPAWRRLEAVVGTSLLSLTGAVDHGPTAATRGLRDALAAAGRPHRTLTPAQVEGRWPGLRADTSALFHKEAGRLDADAAVTALQQAAVARGAEVRHRTRVARIGTRSDGRVEVVTDTEEVLVADQVVVAVGGWAHKALPALGITPPTLRVTQEQPVHFAAPGALDWPSFIHHGGAALPAGSGVYGLGSVDGVKVGFHAVGPVVDPDHRDRSIDLAAEETLRDYASSWLPGVDLDRATSTTCLYTVTPDHDFVIDRRGRVTVLAGFSGHGFKFGSIIGDLAADLVDGKSGESRFALDRR